jgi:hypothetical protein
MKLHLLSHVLVTGSIAFLGACSSAGPYGFARNYVPLGPEEDAAEGAKEYDPVMVERRKHEWVGKKISIFGVVDTVSEKPDGTLDLLLSIRGLQGRNLCHTHDESTCRVTVTDHEFAKIHATTQQAEDKPVKSRDLMRVIGKISEKTHPKTGNWVIVADYSRHWPDTEYVTMKDREFMRQ